MAPPDNLGRSLRSLRQRIAIAPEGEPLTDWLNGQLARPAPARPLDELQAELDSLVGLETVNEQVGALVAFLRVQARRLEYGLPEVATSQHLASSATPARARRRSRACSRRCIAQWCGVPKLCPAR